MQASANDFADAARQAEMIVDKAHPGVDADRRSTLIMAYAVDRAVKFAARDGVGSQTAAAYLRVAAAIAAPITLDTMERVTKALEDD